MTNKQHTHTHTKEKQLGREKNNDFSTNVIYFVPLLANNDNLIN